MDSEIMESLSGFDTLWQRVTAREEPERSAPAEKRTYTLEDALLRLIHEEACAAERAAALSRQMQGEGRTILSRQAADARRHLRRLRAEYYILTGVTAGSNEDCRPVTGKLSSLRDAFLQAGQLAKQYAQTAKLADCPELCSALEDFAAEEQVHARQLRALLVQNF